MACPCRQRSTWPGPSARGSSNKDQPVWGTEQNTGHLLRTHMYTHTHTLSFTRALTCRGSHLFTTRRHAVVHGVSYISCKGQTHSEQHANGNYFLQQHKHIVTCICTTFFSQLSTRTTLAHAHTYLYTRHVIPTINQIPMYGEVCVCEEGRRKEEGV